MTPNAQLSTVRAEKRPRSATLPDISPATERSWFEFDRIAVLRQLDELNGAIEANANDLGMVAVEGVFDQSLSDELRRTSRSLLTIAKDIGTLRGQMRRANGYPKGIRKLT